MLAHRDTTPLGWVHAGGRAGTAAGGLSTLLFTVRDYVLLIYLGGFAGFLLYVGASDILPQAHSARPSGLTMLLTIARGGADADRHPGGWGVRRLRAQPGV